MRFASLAAMGMVGSAVALPRLPAGIANYASRHPGSLSSSSSAAAFPSSTPYSPPPVASPTGPAAGVSPDGAVSALPVSTDPAVAATPVVATTPAVPTESVPGVTPAPTSPASGGATGSSPFGPAFDQAVKIFNEHYSASPSNQAQLVEDNQNIAKALQDSVAIPNNGPHGGPPNQEGAAGASSGVPPPAGTPAAPAGSPPPVIQDPALSAGGQAPTPSVPAVPHSTGAPGQIPSASNTAHWALASDRGINPSAPPPAVDGAVVTPTSPAVDSAAATASPSVDGAASASSPSVDSAVITPASRNPLEN